MQPVRVEVTRGPLVESVHAVSVAVVDADGQEYAKAGDPDLVTYWRSAAKPFQSLPLVADGAADRFGLDDEELALACASHSSEPIHLAVVDRMLEKLGLTEAALACGPHPPLSAEVAANLIRTGVTMTNRWSNCSGKHAGMLALAKHRGWPVEGYQRAGHPLQERLLDEVVRWTSLPRADVVQGVDGCCAVSFAMPLRSMALAYARFGVSTEPAVRRLWAAMTGHPAMVAGTKRVCTEVMAAWPGMVVAKIGAEGIYCAAVPSHRLGVALKVHDGDMASSGVALLAVLRQVLTQRGDTTAVSALGRLGVAGRQPILSTRGDLVGHVQAAGDLAFS